MSHAYEVLRTSVGDNDGKRRTSGVRYASKHLSDGTAVFLIWNFSATRYELWRTSGVPGVNAEAIRILALPTDTFKHPVNNADHQLVDLCVDSGDNIYLIGANWWQPYMFGGYTLIKQSGYVWTAKTNGPTTWTPGASYPLRAVSIDITEDTFGNEQVAVAATCVAIPAGNNLGVVALNIPKLQAGWALASCGTIVPHNDSAQEWDTVTIANVGGGRAAIATRKAAASTDVMFHLWNTVTGAIEFPQSVSLSATSRLRWIARGDGTNEAWLFAGDPTDSNIRCVRYWVNTGGPTSGVDGATATDVGSEWDAPTSPGPQSWNWDAFLDLAEDKAWVLYWDPVTNSTIRRRAVTIATGSTPVFAGTTEIVETSVGWGGTNTVLRCVAKPTQSTRSDWHGEHEDTGDYGLVGDWVAQNTEPDPPAIIEPGGGDPYTPAASIGFWWEFSDADVGDDEESYQLRLRRVVAGAAWAYWDEAGQSFAATPIWSTSQTSEHSSSNTYQTAVIPAGTLTNGIDYEWQVRSRDNRLAESGWSGIAAFRSGTNPSVTVDTVTAGTDGRLTVDWTYQDVEGDPQATFRIKVFAAAGDTLPDGEWPTGDRFDPDIWDCCYDSGIVHDRDLRTYVTGPLQPGSYNVYMQVTEEVTQYASGWVSPGDGSGLFPTVMPGWAPPAIVTAAVQHASRGPYADLTCTDQGNLLSAVQSGVNTSPAGTDWAAVTNCTLSLAPAGWEGAGSLRVTASAGGDAVAATPSGSAMFPVAEDVTYRLSARVLAADTARTCQLEIVWYTAAEALISTSVVASGTAPTGSAWRHITGMAAAPATAAKARMQLRVVGAGASNRVDVDALTFAAGQADSEYVWETGPAGADLKLQYCDLPTGVAGLLVDGVARPGGPPIQACDGLWLFDPADIAGETVGYAASSVTAGVPLPAAAAGPHPCELSGAAVFAGTASVKSTLAAAHTPDELTVACWARTTAAAAGTLFDTSAGTASVEIDAGGQITWASGAGTGDMLDRGRWYWLVWAVTGGGCDVYIDGQHAVTAGAVTARTLSGLMTIGEGWPGSLSLLTIWDSGLTAAQIAWLYAYQKGMFAGWKDLFGGGDLTAVEQLVRDYTAPLNTRRFYRGVR